MKNRKLLLLLVAGLTLSLGACGKKKDDTKPSGGDDTPVTPTPSGENHNVDLDLPEIVPLDEPSVQIHYWRKDATYANWNMWLWEGGKDGARFDFNYKDDWGVVASYPLSTWEDPMANQLGFIVRKSEAGNDWSAKDVESDRFIDFTLYNQDENGAYHIYLKMGDSNLYLDTQGNMRGKIKMATFADENRIAIRTNLGITTASVYKNGEEIYSNDKVGNRVMLDVTIEGGVDYTANYTVKVKLKNDDELTSPVSFSLLFGTESFGKVFNYDGDDLGAVYSAESTSFKVWSPLSSAITLRIYNSGTPGENDHQDYEMTRGEKGVFAKTVEGDLAGKYYTYLVTNGSYKNKEIIDPYAKSCGVNGVRGMIVDFSQTNPLGWDSVTVHPYDRKELTVYETHVADVTSSKTWTGTEANRKLFKGMYESGTTYTEGAVTVSTGFDHIKELGVNAVQIIPLFDQANDEENMSFNWGYNPLNYNCVEGGYSSNPYNGYVRIKEFKELVKAYNEAGINIIMDVVYNHVNSVQGLSFDVLMPEYYFRYTSGGDLSNGSGCGNETASDHYMFRKFMIDSVKFWTSEYKLGGFRFDLMGLHDLATMEELTKEAQKINPNICIYGEPWSGGTSPLADMDSAKQINGNKYVGYGAFNDQMRDSLIKGGLNAKTDLGWITDKEDAISDSDMVKITKGIQGITKAPSTEIADPDKTVNYVTCHDNYTLYDRAIATKKFTAEDDAELAKMNVLANSVVFTSQGITFMLAGEEFLRTKQGDDNSYTSSYEINELDYSLKIKHADMMESYKKLIALKQDTDGLHLDKDHISQVNPVASSKNAVIEYTIQDSVLNRTYKIIHVNGIGTEKTFDLSGYTLYLSTVDGADKVLSAATAAKPYETIIAYK